jgi:hypothetical protein
MPHINTSGSRPTAALMLVLASLALAACGGSSSGSSATKSSSTAASRSASTAPPGQAFGALRKRFTALRECLRKEGITLPKRTPGQAPGKGGLLGGGGVSPLLPAGVSRAKYEAALKKCGGGFPRGGFGGPGGRFSSPVVKQALKRFAACMRTNGVDVPEPNTSGKGPIFNTKGVSTSSAKFTAAENACRSDLRSAFQARPGTPGPAGAGGG